MARLYCIDANGLGHWLFHGRTEKKPGEDGRTTTVPPDLAKATKEWFEEFRRALNPQLVAVCFDGPDNWRTKEFVEYKSGRLAKAPDEAKNDALKTLPQAWMDIGVKTLTYGGFEADDAIAALCNVHAGDECEVVIVSSDKDMMQLVGPRVKQYDPRPNKAKECVFYDAAEVEKKLAVPPHRVPELLAIAGDSADSVPGVEGWGLKTAVIAIRQTKSLREMVRKAREGKLEHISAAKQQVLAESAIDPVDAEGKPALNKNGNPVLSPLSLSLRLVTLRFDIPVPTDLRAFALWSQAA